jgi:hypothetical protein
MLTQSRPANAQRIAVAPEGEPDKLCRGLETMPQLDNAIATVCRGHDRSRVSPSNSGSR